MRAGTKISILCCDDTRHRTTAGCSVLFSNSLHSMGTPFYIEITFLWDGLKKKLKMFRIQNIFSARFLSNLTIRCYKLSYWSMTKLIKEIISRSNFIRKLKEKEKFHSLAAVISHITPSDLMVKTRIRAK